MKKSLVSSVILSALVMVAPAYDSDPGYGARTTSPTAARPKSRTTGPAYYYKPTMRYFGKGYTITYRYVQWNDRMQRGGSTSFSESALNLPVGSVSEGTGQDSRVVVYHPAQPQSQASVVKPSAPSAPTKEVPSISGKAATTR